MDGSGHDSLHEGDPDSWHTWALISMRPDDIVARNLTRCPLFPGISMFKWSGLDPYRPNRKISRSSRSKWQRRVAEILATTTPEHPLVIWAWSFRGRHLYSQIPTMLGALGQAPRRHRNGCGYFLYTDDRFRTKAHLKYDDQLGGRELHSSLGNFLVLGEILFHIKMMKKEIFSGAERVGTPSPTGIIVVSDNICGDDERKQDHSRLLGSLLQLSSGGSINLRGCIEQDTRVGELLVDNVAGFLQSRLVDGTGPDGPDVIAVRRNPSIAVFKWVIHQDDGRRKVYGKQNASTVVVEA
jgi:hypothetical protein